MTPTVDIAKRTTDTRPERYSGLEPYRASGRLPKPESRCLYPRGSLYNLKRGVVYRLGCGRWSCEPCARRKASALSRRFSKIRWLRAPALVTLTPLRSKTHTQCLRRCAASAVAWRRSDAGLSGTTDRFSGLGSARFLHGASYASVTKCGLAVAEPVAEGSTYIYFGMLLTWLRHG